MRVALLTNFIPPYRLGLFKSLASEVGDLRILVSTGMEANRDWPVDWAELDVVRQKTLTLNRTWRTASFAEAYQLHVPYDTLAQLRDYKPAVILTGELGARSAQAALYARAAGVPLVLWATLSDHLEQERGRARRVLRKWLLRQASAIVINGASGARYFERLGFGDKPMVRVPYTTDMQPFLALPVDRARPTDFLFVGGLSERKGAHWLIDAFNECARSVPERAISVTIVGDGPLRTSLQAQSVAANLHVHWAGAVQYEELPRYYADAAALIFPSLGDEWGLVVNEALAAGVPVAGSSYAQAVEELILDNVHGWVFTPDGVHSISAVIERVLATPINEIAEMRVAARDQIRELTSERAARDIAQLLQTVTRS